MLICHNHNADHGHSANHGDSADLGDSADHGDIKCWQYIIAFMTLLK